MTPALARAWHHDSQVDVLSPCRTLALGAGSGPARFRTEPLSCYRAPWRLP